MRLSHNNGPKLDGGVPEWQIKNKFFCHLMNQGSNFLGDSLSNRDNARATI